MSTETRVSFCTMGSSLLLTSSDSGTSMPTESQEESISSLNLTKPAQALELRRLSSVMPTLGARAGGPVTAMRRSQRTVAMLLVGVVIGVSLSRMNIVGFALGAFGSLIVGVAFLAAYFLSKRALGWCPSLLLLPTIAWFANAGWEAYCAHRHFNIRPDIFLTIPGLVVVSILGSVGMIRRRRHNNVMPQRSRG